MSKPRFFITDVFTSRRYAGNPLATLIDCAGLADEEMQCIAREFNFAETTFVTALEPRDGAWDVRIFTPKVEVDFAGHPTLGTAHVIRKHLLQSETDEVVLNLRIGHIPVRFSTTPDGAPLLWMKQAAPQFGTTHEAEILAPVLGLDVNDIEPAWPIAEVSTGLPHIVVPLKNLGALRRMQVNHDHYMALVADGWARIVLAFSRDSYESHQALAVRVFAGFYGVPEDAATGSGNGCLAAYLARHRVLGSSHIDLATGQGYEIGRPSTLALRADETATGLEVFVGGSLVDVAEGVWG